MSTEQAHTPEPWHACSASDGKCQCQGVSDTDGTTVAKFYGNDDLGIEGVTVQCPNIAEGHANRFRAVACVNALAGVPDPAAFVREARETMRAIAALGGNLPDSMLETRTGPNDAAARGIMYINARMLARAFLAKHGGQA